MLTSNEDKQAGSDERSGIAAAVGKPRLVKYPKIVDELQLATSSLLSVHQHHQSQCPLKISGI
jgi:hypothetical protein